MLFAQAAGATGRTLHRLVLSPMRSSPGGPTAVFVAGRIAAPDRRSKFRRRSGPGCGREPLTGRVIPAASTLLAVVVAFVSLQIVAGLRHIWMPRFLRRKTLSRRLVEGTGRTMKKWSRWLDPWLTRGLRPLTRRLRRARRPHLHLSGHTHSPSRIRPLSNERSDDDRRHIRAGTVGQKRVPHGARLCCEPRRRLSDLPASDVVRLAA